MDTLDERSPAARTVNASTLATLLSEHGEEMCRIDESRGEFVLVVSGERTLVSADAELALSALLASCGEAAARNGGTRLEFGEFYSAFVRERCDVLALSVEEFMTALLMPSHRDDPLPSLRLTEATRAAPDGGFGARSKCDAR